MAKLDVFSIATTVARAGPYSLVHRREPLLKTGRRRFRGRAAERPAHDLAGTWHHPQWRALRSCLRLLLFPTNQRSRCGLDLGRGHRSTSLDGRSGRDSLASSLGSIYGYAPSDARANFPQLVAFLICLGMPVGVTLGTSGQFSFQRRASPKFSWGRAIVAGGLAGTLAGFVFGQWVSSGNYFPLLAGYRELSSHSASVTSHFCRRATDRGHVRSALSARRTRPWLLRWPGAWVSGYSGGFLVHLRFPH